MKALVTSAGLVLSVTVQAAFDQVGDCVTEAGTWGGLAPGAQIVDTGTSVVVPGSTYANGVFTPPLPAELPSRHVKYVMAAQPSSLGNAGKTMLDDATAQVSGLNSPQATVQFNDYDIWALEDPLVQQLKGALQLTDAQFSSLWLQAAAQ